MAKRVSVEVGFDDDMYPSRRDKEVLAVIVFPDKTLLASRKSFYPEGIFRLPGGGIEEGETPEEAVRREVYEETGITESKSEPLVVVEYLINSKTKKTRFTSHVFLLRVQEQKVHAMDKEEDIAEFKRVDLKGFKEMAKRLGELGPGVKRWGEFRKASHEIIARELATTGL